MLEFQLTPNSISTIHLWLTALLGMSFLLTVVYLLQFVSARFVLNCHCDRFSKLLLAVLASLQIFTWQLYFYRGSHDTVALWCFPLALISGTLVWRLSNGSLAVHPLFVRILPVVIVLVSFVEFAGFAQATKQFSLTALTPSLGNSTGNLANPGTLVEKTENLGTTDRGTRIQLLERQVTASAFKDYLAKCQQTHLPMSQKAMMRVQPFVQSNCHGWVFTQGQHILRGEDVQLILDDNNYTLVSKPQSNDVAVYRSDDGVILHTGVVRGSLEGATIVESKWGVGAVYLHIGEEQPYSQNISYYRTDRPTHEILISNTKQKVDATAEISKARNQFQATM